MCLIVYPRCRQGCPDGPCRCPLLTVGREEVDLTEQAQLRRGLAEAKPDVIVLAAAKIAGIRLCQAYRTQYGRNWISAMPTNL